MGWVLQLRCPLLASHTGRGLPCVRSDTRAAHLQGLADASCRSQNQPQQPWRPGKGVRCATASRGRSNHDLNAFLAPGRAAERRLGIRAIGTPQVAMGDQPNRPDNAQDQHDHEIPVTRVPQYVPPEHLDLVHNRYFRPASRHRVWLCLCGIHARSAGDEHCRRVFYSRPRPRHVRCNLGRPRCAPTAAESPDDDLVSGTW